MFEKESKVLIDLHVHSTSTPDCFFDAHDVIQAVRKAHLDGCVLMDTLFHDDAEELKSFGKDAGVMVLFGREIYTSAGHVLAYAPDYNSLRDLPWGEGDLPSADAVINHVKSLGGAAVAAHPYCREYEHPMGDTIFTLKALAAIESDNAVRGKMTNDLAAEAAFSMQLPCTGGSDAKHSLDPIGNTATLFRKDITNEADIVAALLSGGVWPVRLGEFPVREDPRDRRGFGGGGQYQYRRDDNRGGRRFGSRDGGGVRDRRDDRRGPGGGGGDNRRGGGGGRDRGRLFKGPPKGNR
jgi:hypothetical protein